MSLTDLFLLALGTWYVAFVATEKDGPYKIFALWRKAYPLGGLTTCIVCMSIWVAAIAVVLWYLAYGAPFSVLYFIQVFAVAGGALMINNVYD